MPRLWRVEQLVDPAQQVRGREGLLQETRTALDAVSAERLVRVTGDVENCIPGLAILISSAALGPVSPGMITSVTIRSMGPAWAAETCRASLPSRAVNTR
jgi:hypothetical protein